MFTLSSLSLPSLEQRMRNVLNQIQNAYDFSQFTIPSFLEWVHQKTGREPILLPVELPGHFYGAWIRDAELPLEYLVYNSLVSPYQQFHAILHEISHLLLNHQTIWVTEEQIEAILNGGGIQSLAGIRFHSDLLTERNIHETEAEKLALLIEELVLRTTPSLPILQQVMLLQSAP